MASNQYLVSSSRAGLGSVVVTRDSGNTQAYLISNIGVMPIVIIPGVARMDGQAQMSASGIGMGFVTARMDGQAQMLGVTVVTINGAARMDGQSEMSATGGAMAVGEAAMDGRAQMAADSIDMVKGAAAMAGTGQMVAISVEGAAIAQMDGEAAMAAVAPVFHKAALSETFTSGQAISVRMVFKPTLSQEVATHEVMKPKVRYHLVLSNAINWSSTTSFRMKFVKVLKDTTITMTSRVAPHTQFHYAIDLPIGVQPTVIPKWHAVLGLTQNLEIGQSTNLKFLWGRTLKQGFNVSPSLNAHSRYMASLAQLFKIFEVEGLKLRHPVVLDQNINLSLSLIGTFGVKLLQKLQITSKPLPALSYHLALASQVIAKDTLEHLIDALVEELFTVHPTLERRFVANQFLTQLLTLHPALGNKLVLKLVGNIQLHPEQLVSMLYRGDPLLDSVTITALYISPSGTTTTWAVNTRTAAITEYANYDFRSFAQMGSRYIAAGPDGLYELDGDTDDGAAIVANLMGGYLQLNEKKLFGIKGAYIAIRGGGRFYLKLISGDGREYVYELKAQPNMMTTKVKVGKGISTTYMAWELITEGQDFDLDSIEFIPMTRGRRV